jgi:hypothetical protein
MQRVEENDLVWTRDEMGVYYLGRVNGAWQYSGEKEHVEADICSYYLCEWIAIGSVDNVPGSVVNSFIMGPAIRRIKDDNKSIAWYTAKLWNEMATEMGNVFSYNVSEKPAGGNFWEFISHEDCEDVVGLYLQLKHEYAIIPGTCKASTAGYEYVLTHRKSGDKAVVQVKQGSSTKLMAKDYEDFTLFGEVFLFNSQGLYEIDKEVDRITCLTVAEIETFTQQHKHVLPLRVKAWLDTI